MEAMYEACGGHSTHDLCECGILHVTDEEDAPSQEEIDQQYGVDPNRKTNTAPGGVYHFHFQGRLLVVDCECGEAYRVATALWDARRYIAAFFRQHAGNLLGKAMQDAGIADAVHEAAQS